MQKLPTPRIYPYEKFDKQSEKMVTAWGYEFNGNKKIEKNKEGMLILKRNLIRERGFKTKAEAKTAAQKAIDEHFKTGGNTENLTVNDLFDRYINNCRANGKADGSIGTYTNIISKWCLSEIGDFKLKDIKRLHAEEIGNEIKTSGKSPHTINSYIDNIKNMFEYAVRQEYIAKNPFNAVDHVKTGEQVNPHQAFNKQEMQEILAAYKDEFILYPFIFIADQTGMRPSEICGLTWNCVDFENKTITVNKQLHKHPTDKQLYLDAPKCNSKREIGITDKLVTFLKEYKTKVKRKTYSKDKNGRLIDGNSFSFVLTKEDGTRVFYDDISGRLAYLKNEKGYPPFKPHDFRGTYATKLYKNCNNVKYTQNQMGHKNPNTTFKNYTKLDEEDRKNNNEKLDDWI